MYNGNCTKEEIAFILNKVDKNKSGKIDFSEFKTAVYGRKKLFVKDSLIEAFDYWDTGKTGFLDKKCLKNILKGCEKTEVEDILLKIDTNKDNKISKFEFIDYFLSLA